MSKPMEFYDLSQKLESLKIHFIITQDAVLNKFNLIAKLIQILNKAIMFI